MASLARQTLGRTDLGILPVPTQVMLTCGLPRDIETAGDLWPADAECYRVVDQQCQLGVQFVALLLGSADALDDLGSGEPGDSLRRCRRRGRPPEPVVRPRLDPGGDPLA